MSADATVVDTGFMDGASLLAGREKRARKAPDRFEDEKLPEVRKRPELVIEPGKGAKLGDIPGVRDAIASTLKKERILKQLHHVLFPGYPVKEQGLKKNLREFSGYTVDKSRVKAESKLSALRVDDIKSIAGILRLSSHGRKEEIVARILEFLEEPDTAKTIPKEPKKRGRTASKKKPAKKAKKAKKVKAAASTGPRKISGYMQFANENRAHLKQKYPDATFGDMGKILGAAWKALSQEEKDAYTARAAFVKPKEKKAPRAKKQPAAVQDMQEDSDSGVDDEEDDDGGYGDESNDEEDDY